MKDLLYTNKGKMDALAGFSREFEEYRRAQRARVGLHRALAEREARIHARVMRCSVQEVEVFGRLV